MNANNNIEQGTMNVPTKSGMALRVLLYFVPSPLPPPLLPP